MTVKLDGATLQIQDVVRVARPDGKGRFAQAELAPEARERIAATRAYIDSNWMHDDAPLMYAFNTGVGLFKDQRVLIAEGEAADHVVRAAFGELGAQKLDEPPVRLVSVGTGSAPSVPVWRGRRAKSGTLGVYYYDFGFKNNPMLDDETRDNSKLRQAISMAIDRRALGDLHHARSKSGAICSRRFSRTHLQDDARWKSAWRARRACWRSGRGRKPRRVRRRR